MRTAKNVEARRIEIPVYVFLWHLVVPGTGCLQATAPRGTWIRPSRSSARCAAKARLRAFLALAFRFLPLASAERCLCLVCPLFFTSLAPLQASSRTPSCSTVSWTAARAKKCQRSASRSALWAEKGVPWTGLQWVRWGVKARGGVP